MPTSPVDPQASTIRDLLTAVLACSSNNNNNNVTVPSTPPGGTAATTAVTPGVPATIRFLMEHLILPVNAI